MRLRWKILLAVTVGIVSCILIFFRTDDDRARTALEETRERLRKEGFKTDLGEFDFSTDSATQAREAALTQANLIGGDGFRPTVFGELPLMKLIGSNSAVVLWQQEKLQTQFGEDGWTELRERIREKKAELNAAAEAALAGPVAFNLPAGHGNGMLLRHAPMLKQLTRIFSLRALLSLHDGLQDDAWTNVMAATRLTTAYDPEAVEISHMVRFSCTSIAFDAVWQALQSNRWPDERLLALQREWAAADFFKGLPETVAFSRASSSQSYQQEREQPARGVTFGMTWGEVIQSPIQAWRNFRYYLQQNNFRSYGIYLEEKALLLHFRDRELEWRRAVTSPTWRAMQQLPGVTTNIPFEPGSISSQTASLLNMRQISLGIQRGSAGTLGRAITAETRRRLVIAAIALERHRSANGAYPESLDQLVPTFLDTVPIDFMDGRPLRYKRTGDRFILYSVGLDCTDDAGALAPPPDSGMPNDIWEGMRPTGPSDIVWPSLGLKSEVDAQQQTELEAERAQQNMEDLRQANWRWSRTAKRQAQVEQLLAEPPALPIPKDTALHGRPAIEFLHNKINGNQPTTVEEMLTLRPLVTGAEPEIATFELLLSYNAITNLGELALLVDPTEDDDGEDGCRAVSYECRPHTNGNCLLVWQTGLEPPGRHALQAMLSPTDPDTPMFCGPLLDFTSSNVCQFSESSLTFAPRLGATLLAKLPEAKANYEVEFTSPDGKTIQRIKGTTSDGMVAVWWDLKDDQGNSYTNDSFGSVIHLTFPASGITRSQKGP